jgi:hypothetical protein
MHKNKKNEKNIKAKTNFIDQHQPWFPSRAENTDPGNQSPISPT